MPKGQWSTKEEPSFILGAKKNDDRKRHPLRALQILLEKFSGQYVNLFYSIFLIIKRRINKEENEQAGKTQVSNRTKRLIIRKAFAIHQRSSIHC